MLSEMVEAVTEDEIAFSNDMTLSAFPCSSRAGRGWPIFALALDEAAHLMTETEGFQAGARVLEALMPATAQFGRDARVIISSTPYGSDGFFPAMFEQAASGELPDAIAQQASTAEANPMIDPGFLEAERARDPDGFAGEYEAQFVGSGSNYLDATRVDAALAERGELEPSACARWIAGLDPAFSSDPFGLAIVGLDPDGSGRLRLGLARSWKPRKGATFDDRREHEDRVLGEVAEVVRAYCGQVVTDQFAAPAILDRLRREGLSVEMIPMGPGTKTSAYQELRSRLYLESLELYHEPGLIAELKRLRSKFTAGQAAVVNPRVNGSHGDMAQALALAVYQFDRWGLPRSLGTRTQSLNEPAIARLSELEKLFAPTPARRTRRWYDASDDPARRVF